MEIVKNQEFGGERPLYAKKNGLKMDGVTIHPGESSVKEGCDIEADNCVFEGKYALWCGNNILVKNSLFKETARSSVWHSSNLKYENVRVEAPKMFRECDGVVLRKVDMPLAQETFWSCRNIDAEDITADNADYIFEWCQNVRIRNFRLNGNYSFQHAKNVEIWDSDLQTKDSFWEAENVTVYNSFINGEYLAWHSKNVRLVNCRIGGTQPLCYADSLVLENCTFEPDADLAFEYSDVKATVSGHIISVKNPRTGYIRANSIGEIIIDDNIKEPGDCIITTL